MTEGNAGPGPVLGVRSELRCNVSRGPHVTEGNAGPGPVQGLRPVLQSGLRLWFAYSDCEPNTGPATPLPLVASVARLTVAASGAVSLRFAASVAVGLRFDASVAVGLRCDAFVGPFAVRSLDRLFSSAFPRLPV